ncbi:MAG: nitroreductase family protein, partial [Lachnospiraceae bacterium]
MEFQKVIETRRSMRKYDPDKKVTEEMVRELIHAASL